MPIAGVLAESSVGWPSIFYLFGTLSIIWSVVYYYLGADAPSNHRSISQEERMYIEEQLRTTEAKSDDEIKKVKIHYNNQMTLCYIYICFLFNNFW